MSIILVSQPPSLTQLTGQVQCLLPPGEICSSSSPNWTQWRRTENNNRAENVSPGPMSKRRNTKTDEEKQCEKKELNQARATTRIHVRASFQRWKSCCKDFSVKQVRTCFIYVLLYVLTTRLWWRWLQYNNTGNSAYCHMMWQLPCLLACMLTPVFSFVSMATG